MFQW